MKAIVSRDNPLFKSLRKLATSGRERRQSGQALLDGLHLLEALLESGGEPDLLIFSERGLQRAEIVRWLAHCPPPLARIPRICLPDALHDELAATETPGGILSRFRIPAATPQADLRQNSVLLDDIQDPGNVGTLLRTALAAGFRQVLLSAHCAALWSPKVLRAAQGAHFSLHCLEAADLTAFVRDFQGTTLVTALTPDAGSLYESTWTLPVAWIFGSEGQGVQPALQQRASQRIRIPMPGQTESLNVGAAAAVCLFETLRRTLPPARTQPVSS